MSAFITALPTFQTNSSSASTSTSVSARYLRPFPCSANKPWLSSSSLPIRRAFLNNVPSTSTSFASTISMSSSSSTFKYVVIGAGNAAGYLARRFIENGGAPNDLCIIGDEAHLPYERPALSKAVLFNEKVRLPGFNTCVGGGGDRQDVDWYETNGIITMLSSRVTGIDVQSKTMTLANGNTVVATDGLVLATGANPIKLNSMPGADLNGIHYLRNNTDAMQLYDALQQCKGKNVVVIGGGYIGMEVAAAANIVECNVTMVFPETHMMSRLFTRDIAEQYEDFYKSKGISFLKHNVLANEFVPSESDSQHVGGVRVKLADSSTKVVPADCVIVGVGAVPETALVKNVLKMDGRGGVVVDGNLQSSAPGIFAIGDIATFPISIYNNALTRMEHVQNCRDMAQHVCDVMMNKQKKSEEVYDYLPYFYSRVYDLGWKFYGRNEGRCVVVGKLTDDNGKDNAKMMALWIAEYSEQDKKEIVEGVWMESPSDENTKLMEQLARTRPVVDEDLIESIAKCENVQQALIIVEQLVQLVQS